MGKRGKVLLLLLLIALSLFSVSAKYGDNTATEISNYLASESSGDIYDDIIDWDTPNNLFDITSGCTVVSDANAFDMYTLQDYDCEYIMTYPDTIYSGYDDTSNNDNIYLSGICVGKLSVGIPPACEGVTDMDTCNSNSDCYWLTLCCNEMTSTNQCPAGQTYQNGVCVDGCRSSSECTAGSNPVCVGGSSMSCSGTYTVPSCEPSTVYKGLIPCNYYFDANAVSNGYCDSNAPAECVTNTCQWAGFVFQEDICPTYSASECSDRALNNDEQFCQTSDFLITEGAIVDGVSDTRSCSKYNTQPSDCEAHSSCTLNTGSVGQCCYQNPSGEICANGIDDDCDGSIDEVSCSYVNLSNCQVCHSDSECASGICSADSLGSSTKHCVSSTNCALNTISSCESPLSSKRCSGNYLATCSSGNDWTYSSCPYGCSSNSCNPAPVTTLSWKDETDYTIPSTSSVSPYKSKLPITFTFNVDNPTSTSGTFSLSELSGSEHYTLTGFPATISGSSVQYKWTIEDQSILDHTGVPSSTNLYQFQFSYGSDGSSNILYFSKTLTHCDNDIIDWDFGELALNCGGSDCVACTSAQLCSNGQIDVSNGETDIDCGGPNCASCGTKELYWTTSSGTRLSDGYTMNVDLDSLASTPITVRAIVSYPDSTTTPFKFYDYDSGNADEKTLVDGTGTYNSTSDYVYSDITIDIDTLMGLGNSDIKDDDSSNLTYELYFNADGDDSPTLNIKINDALPVCSAGDGCTSGESIYCSSSTDCDCAVQEINSCSDYGSDRTRCISNSCGVTLLSGTSCYFNPLTDLCEGSVVNRQYNGIDIGSCFYSEDTASDTCEDDGLLTYSWTTSWQWAQTNTGVSPVGGVCEDDYILYLSDGLCYYDPENAMFDCQSEDGQSATIPCSAQVQLSFFTWKNFVSAILIVIIAYIIISYARRQRPKSTKKTQPKDIASKKKAAKKKVSKKK